MATFDEVLKKRFGLESCTTFWSDFCIADKFGEQAVKDTYKNSEHWISDVEMWTELVIVLNMKCWIYYEKGNMTLSKVYSDLYHKANTKAYDTYKGEEMDYYFRYTD